jgi:hypothetical protein
VTWRNSTVTACGSALQQNRDTNREHLPRTCIEGCEEITARDCKQASIPNIDRIHRTHPSTVTATFSPDLQAPSAPLFHDYCSRQQATTLLSMMVVASLNKSKTPCVPSPYTPTQKETFHLALPARSLFVVQGSEDGPKRQKIDCSQELWQTCIGRESNPGLADII